MQTMNKNISSLLLAALAVLPLASCMSDDDNDDTTYYDDTAITSFSLGTLKQHHVTKAADGITDSTYTTTFSGSSYKFNIDQVGNTIYNTDSLPYGTDATHVLATISSKNSGIIVFVKYGPQGQDSLKNYVSQDSIDFSQPVILRVYNMRGTAYKQYNVKVNIHQQDGDAFSWNSTTGDFAGIEARKIVATASNTYLFGTNGSQTVGYRKNGNTWEEVTTISDANAYKNVTAFQGDVYTIANGSIYRSDDGESWEQISATQGITAIAGASKSRIYALTDNGIVYSTDGKTWLSDNIDDSATLLPDEDINFTSQVSVIDSSVYHLVLIGNRNGKTVIWSKVEEDDNASSSEPWAYYSYDEYNRKTLPYLKNLQVVAYDNGLLATGGDLTKFYHSPDMGLTWDTVSTYALPGSYTGTIAPFSMTCDASNNLLISKSGVATVLTGRLGKMGWKKQDTVFTK